MKNKSKQFNSATVRFEHRRMAVLSGDVRGVLKTFLLA
jgi:hypothetical protein